MGAAAVAAIFGVLPYENDCFDKLHVREGGSSSGGVPWFIFGEHCEGHRSQVPEATVVYWYSIAAAITVGAGVWFAAVGLLRVVRPRLAVLGWLVSVIGFVIATAGLFG